jgi:hypothetical protein
MLWTGQRGRTARYIRIRILQRECRRRSKDGKEVVCRDQGLREVVFGVC